MAQVLYEERATPPGAWRAVYVAMAGAVLLCGLFGVGSFVDGALVGVLLAVLLGGIALLTLWSMERYSRIRLTPDALRVGRERVAVADLDPRPLLQQAAERPRIAPRWPQAFGVDLSDAPVTGVPPLMGGAHAEPLGHQVVFLLTRDGRYRRVPTKDPDALLDALLGASVQG